MIALIEMIFGSKVGRILAEIVLGALLLGSAALYLEHRGALGELAKLQKSSVALLAQAKKDIQVETDKHAADVKANEGKTNEVLAANAALQSQLDQRVRDFDAYRRAHPDVPRSVGGPGAASEGECGVISCGELASQLAVRGNELARSVADLTALLQSAQRDRDSLTGLPSP